MLYSIVSHFVCLVLNTVLCLNTPFDATVSHYQLLPNKALKTHMIPERTYNARNSGTVCKDAEEHKHEAHIPDAYTSSGES